MEQLQKFLSMWATSKSSRRTDRGTEKEVLLSHLWEVRVCNRTKLTEELSEKKNIIEVIYFVKIHTIKACHNSQIKYCSQIEKGDDIVES